MEYINNKNGWTIIGWQRLGDVDDFSSFEKDNKIDNPNVTICLSLLIPTSKSDEDSNNVRRLKIPIRIQKRFN